VHKGWAVADIVLVIAIMTVRISAQAQPPWLPSYQAALAHIKGGESETGVRELEQLGTSFPNDAVLATSIGAALDSVSRHQQAQHWYERALAIRPQYVPALNNLALSFASQGELERSVPPLQKILKIDANNGRAAYNLALILLRLKRYNEAVDAFQNARRAPESAASPEAMALGEGAALFKLRRYTEARTLLGHVSACSQLASCLLLGSSQALSDELPTAVTTFQTAVRLAPNSPDAYFRLALAFMEGRRDNEAKQALAVGLEAVPNSARLLYGQAIFYEYIGSYEEAIAAATKSIVADPGGVEVWSLLGSLHAHQGQGEEAQNAFQKALQMGAGVDTAVEYAELLLHEGHYAEAEKALTLLHSSHANDASVNRGLGKLYKAEGKFEEAETYLQRAVTEDPQDPTAHYALAISLQRLHRDEEAKRELDLFAAAKEQRRFIHVLEIASDPVGLGRE
jgi:tetratricopeptide (TPR) repeat protein